MTAAQHTTMLACCYMPTLPKDQISHLERKFAAL